MHVIRVLLFPFIINRVLVYGRKTGSRSAVCSTVFASRTGRQTAGLSGFRLLKNNCVRALTSPAPCRILQVGCTRQRRQEGRTMTNETNHAWVAYKRLITDFVDADFVR